MKRIHILEYTVTLASLAAVTAAFFFGSGILSDTFFSLIALVLSAVAAGASLWSTRTKLSRVQSRQIFLAYSHRDRDKAEALASWLKTSGYQVWIDEDMIQPGANWQNEIEEAIFRSSAVLAIVTPNLLASAEVSAELRMALRIARSNVQGVSPVIPVTVDSGFSDLPDSLKGIQAVDFTSPEGRTKLEKALSRLSAAQG
jgi:hypothetical protein